MKTVILAGGRGERLGGAAAPHPKALTPVCGRPIIEHVMSAFVRSGFNDFMVATGFRSSEVAQYFETTRTARRTITCLDTGLHTQTGGRVRRALHAAGSERVFLTYTDGVANLDLQALLAFHDRSGCLATVTAVHPPSRFGHLTLNSGKVNSFEEKPIDLETWINGGFFVLEPGVAEQIEGDATSFEAETLPRLAACGQLAAFEHAGYWRCLDTPADIRAMEIELQSQSGEMRAS
jgi:glucose-1-phosphate cytidylyltransferase